MKAALPLQKRDWPPVHRPDARGVYMVTAATLHKVGLFNTADKLDLLERDLLALAKQYDFQLQAWPVFTIYGFKIDKLQADEY